MLTDSSTTMRLGHVMCSLTKSILHEYISIPSHSRPEARVTAEASSTLPDDFAKYTYDGDVNAKSVQTSSITAASDFNRPLNTCRAHAKAGLTLTPEQRQLLLRELGAGGE
ncbi:hypothetical protein ACMFMG_001428 [Clarireedia jacksonii]